MRVRRDRVRSIHLKNRPASSVLLSMSLLRFAALLLVTISLFGCDGPLGLPFTNVDRPEYNNPVDPESRVLLTEILPLIPDANFRAIVQNTGAVYNSDVRSLWVDSVSGVSSIEGIKYLPALDSLEIDYPGVSIDFSPLSGHARLQRLRASNGFAFSDIATIPVVGTLSSLDISGTTGTWTLTDLPALPLLELRVSSTNLSTLSGITRFPKLRTLDISSTAVPGGELSTELVAIAGTLRDLRVNSQASYSFLGSLTALEFFGVELGGTDLLGTAMTEIASYGPFEGLSFRGINALDPLSNLSGSGVEDLELAFVTPMNLVGTDFSGFNLRRLAVENVTTLTSIPSLPSTISELEVRSAALTNVEIADIASSFPELRRLDVSDGEPAVAPDPSFDTLISFSTYASLLQNLEEIIARDTVITALSTSNGIPELSVLPNLRFVDLGGTPAAGDPVGSGINALINNTNGRVDVNTF